jgi:hypothetical protein
MTAICLLLIGCSSAAPDSKKATAPVTEPEIKIIQLSSVSGAARYITGPISVQYRLDVANRATDQITVKRVDVQSIGYGAYTLAPVSHPFEVVLKPGETKSMQLWAPARIDDPSIVGANGPVTLRITLHYDTRAGATQSTVVQQVHASPIVD